MVGKRILPSSPSEPQETQLNPKTIPTLLLLLPHLVTPSDTNEDNHIVRLLVEEDAWCVGSCNGCLFLLDAEDATPFVVSASTSNRFYLPPLETLPFPPQVGKPYFMELLRKNYITKAVVVGNPDTDDSFTAVVLYTNSVDSNLAYCKKGERSWNALPGKSGSFSFHEIMVRREVLHALTTELVVQTWDLSGPEPVLTQQVQPSIPRTMWEADLARTDLYFSKFYLAELPSGEVLLVVRHVGYYVNGDGVAVEEDDLVVCPYRTLKFHVYKAGLEENAWVQVESLGQTALFLGCNNSVSLPAGGLAGFEGNSIYFSDDNWEQMNEDYLYGGHDLGKFHLQRGRVEPIDDVVFDRDDDRIDPPPFWVVPCLVLISSDLIS